MNAPLAEFGIPLVIIAVLILLNGLFVAAEFAIAGVSRPAIQRRANDGNRAARAVATILENPRNQDRYIATAQLGITAASLGLGMYGEHEVAGWIYEGTGEAGMPALIASHGAATFLAVAVLTYFHIVVGEMVPKALALQRAERTALWVTPPMAWIRRILFPFVVGLNGIGNAVLRVVGVRREHGSEQYYTVEELRFVVSESHERGELADVPASVISELFEFGRLTADEVMVPRVRVTGVPAGITQDEIAALLRDGSHTRYPVYEGDLDHILGFVRVKDLWLALHHGSGTSGLPRELIRAAPVVPETSTLDTILGIMRRETAHMVVVIDEHGGTAGIITVEDLFEEVIGDISEDTADRGPLFETEAGEIHALGTVRLDQVGEHFDRVLEDEDVDTVSGLVLKLLDRPPQVGDQVDAAGIRFRVVAVSGYGVAECAVELAPPTRAADPYDEPDAQEPE